MTRLFDLSIWCINQGYATEVLPFILMEDAFEMLTLQQVEDGEHSRV